MNYRLLINIMIVFTLLVGQVSIESTPKSFSLEQSIDIQTQTLPAFDIQKFIDEDILIIHELLMFHELFDDC